MNPSALSRAPFLSLVAVGIALAASPCRADDPLSPILPTDPVAPRARPTASPASAGAPGYRVVREDLPDPRPFARSEFEFGFRTGATVIPWDYSSWPSADRSGTAIGPAWGGFALARFYDWGIGASFERSLLSWPARAVNYPTAQFTSTMLGPFLRFPFVHEGRADPYLQLGLQLWSIGTPYGSGNDECGSSAGLVISVELGADWYVTDFLKLGPYIAVPFPFLGRGCSNEDDLNRGEANGPEPPRIRSQPVSFGLATTFAVDAPLKKPSSHRY
jgi:hypothetical protein